MAANTGRRKREPMPADEMHNRYPSTKVLSGSGRESEEAWVAVFTARPDAMHSLLADFIKQVHAQPGRIGQRPMPAEEEVDLESLIFATNNEDPLPVAIRKNLKVSERAFASRLFMSRSQFQRMMAGQYKPEVSELRQIAAALKKPPAYFAEYRKAMAMAAFEDLIDRRPGIATSLYRKYIEVRSGK